VAREGRQFESAHPDSSLVLRKQETENSFTFRKQETENSFTLSEIRKQESENCISLSEIRKQFYPSENRNQTIVFTLRKY
jgi:hypothetical protein